jgi:PAS domain S-box-containing protein
MVLTDQDGIVLTANPAYCQLYGYTADDILGQHFTIGFLPEDRDRVAAQYRAMFAGAAPLHVFENVIRRADGARRTIETRAEFLSHEDQRYAMLSIIRDITERKQSELALRAQTETLQSINRIGQLLSAELDLQKLVQAVTDAATELTGAAFGSFFYNLTDDRGERYTLYTLSGVPREAFANFPMPRNTHVFGPTFRGEGIIRLDNVKQDPRYGQNPPFAGMPQGHLPVTSYMAVPVVSRSGEVLGGLFFGHPEPGVFGEQTEQLVVGLAAQAAIAMDNARLYQQAQAAIRIRDQFLSIASHELKTPLTSLFGHAQLLEHRTARLEVLPERERRSVRVIVDQASRLNTMIADLLDISRIELGQLRIEQEPVDLAGLTRQVVEEVIPSLERHTISASIEAAPLVVRGDALRLEQVVQNLISNAIKYSPQGRQVTVQVARRGPQACVAVSDEGIGIPKSELPRLFNRFYRASNVETQRINGMGIGLYVVKEVVTLHRGTVTVESVEGQGSTFTVCLPLMEPEHKHQTVDK